MTTEASILQISDHRESDITAIIDEGDDRPRSDKQPMRGSRSNDRRAEVSEGSDVLQEQVQASITDRLDRRGGGQAKLKKTPRTYAEESQNGSPISRF
jgi:hypothetical protein